MCEKPDVHNQGPDSLQSCTVHEFELKYLQWHRVLRLRLNIAHQRFSHDDTNLVFRERGEVGKEALEDIFAWLALRVDADGHHGWGPSLSAAVVQLCPLSVTHTFLSDSLIHSPCLALPPVSPLCSPD